MIENYSKSISRRSSITLDVFGDDREPLQEYFSSIETHFESISRRSKNTLGVFFEGRESARDYFTKVENRSQIILRWSRITPKLFQYNRKTLRGYFPTIGNHSEIVSSRPKNTPGVFGMFLVYEHYFQNMFFFYLIKFFDLLASWQLTRRVRGFCVTDLYQIERLCLRI